MKEGNNLPLSRKKSGKLMLIGKGNCQPAIQANPSIPVTPPKRVQYVTGRHFGNRTRTRQTCGLFTAGLPIPVLHPKQNTCTKVFLVISQPILNRF
jgi:hypothetical protein